MRLAAQGTTRCSHRWRGTSRDQVRNCRPISNAHIRLCCDAGRAQAGPFRRCPSSRHPKSPQRRPRATLLHLCGADHDRLLRPEPVEPQDFRQASGCIPADASLLVTATTTSVAEFVLTAFANKDTRIAASANNADCANPGRIKTQRPCRTTLCATSSMAYKAACRAPPQPHPNLPAQASEAVPS